MAGRRNHYFNHGWISVYRQLANSDFWLSETFTKPQAWVDLLLKAQHKEGFIIVRGIKVPLQRGQVGWSMKKLAERWDWSRGKVKRFFNELVKEGMIVQQTNTLTSIITIVNYDYYQNSEQQTDTKQASFEQQMDTNNNEKKKNNDINEKEEFSPPLENQVISFFSEIGSSSTEGEKFYNYYTSNGWKVGQNPMIDWKASAQNWAHRSTNFIKPSITNKNERNESDF